MSSKEGAVSGVGPKRKQNTACDACKLRKIKCSLSTLSDDPSNPSNPLSDDPQSLAHQKCTRCIKMDLDCTKSFIANKIPQSVYGSARGPGVGAVQGQAQGPAQMAEGGSGSGNGAGMGEAMQAQSQQWQYQEAGSRRQSIAHGLGTGGNVSFGMDDGSVRGGSKIWGSFGHQTEAHGGGGGGGGQGNLSMQGVSPTSPNVPLTLYRASSNSFQINPSDIQPPPSVFAFHENPNTSVNNGDGSNNMGSSSMGRIYPEADYSNIIGGLPWSGKTYPVMGRNEKGEFVYQGQGQGQGQMGGTGMGMAAGSGSTPVIESYATDQDLQTLLSMGDNFDSFMAGNDVNMPGFAPNPVPVASGSTPSWTNYLDSTGPTAGSENTFQPQGQGTKRSSQEEGTGSSNSPTPMGERAASINYFDQGFSENAAKHLLGAGPSRQFEPDIDLVLGNSNKFKSKSRHSRKRRRISRDSDTDDDNDDEDKELEDLSLTLYGSYHGMPIKLIPQRNGDGRLTGSVVGEHLDEMALRRIDQSLSMRADRKELSRQFVNTYFNVAHAQFPLIDPDELARRFNAAGQDPLNMSKADQVTCAAIEAWAARYTWHPAVIRGEERQIQTLTNGSSTKYAMPLIPKSQRENVGFARNAVCRSLMQRAIEMMDNAGLMRKPSVDGLKAMLLVQNLMLGSAAEEKGKTEEVYKERAMIMASISEQMKILHKDKQLIDFAKDKNPTEWKVPESFRLVWTAWMNDAFHAATVGVEPRFEEGSVEDMTGVTEDSATFRSIPEEPVTYGQFQQAFRIGYLNAGKIARYIAAHISIPAKTPKEHDINSMLRAVRVTWRAEEHAQRLLQEACGAVTNLHSIRAPVAGLQSLLAAFLNVQVLLASCSAITLHFAKERLTYEQRVTDSARIGSLDTEDLKVAQQLCAEATGQALKSARGLLPLLTAVLGYGIFQNAGGILMNIVPLAEILVQTPVVEQGYQDAVKQDFGEWDWASKVEAMKVYIEALSQCTVAWPHATEALQHLRKTMRDVTPENLPPFQENEAMDPSRLDSQTMSKIVERIMSLSVVDSSIVKEHERIPRMTNQERTHIEDLTYSWFRPPGTDLSAPLVGTPSAETTPESWNSNSSNSPAGIDMQQLSPEEISALRLLFGTGEVGRTPGGGPGGGSNAMDPQQLWNGQWQNYN